jgi:hypothetical protein
MPRDKVEMLAVSILSLETQDSHKLKTPGAATTSK